MVMSKASTVTAYLDELPDERRAVIEPVLKVLRKHMPKGFHEVMGFGMINFVIPLERYRDTYNKHPLMYTALAAQKNYNSVYLMGAYSSLPRAVALREAFEKEGKKLDMGKSCVRFKTLDDIPLEAIGRFVGATTVEEYIALYEASRPKRK